MFFMQIMEAFLVRTDPASSMVKPAHIHMTRAPHTRKEKVLKTKAVSSSTPKACATPGREEHEQDGGDAGRGEDDGDTVSGHDPLQWLHSVSPPPQHHAQPGKHAESTIAEP